MKCDNLISIYREYNHARRNGYRIDHKDRYKLLKRLSWPLSCHGEDLQQHFGRYHPTYDHVLDVSLRSSDRLGDIIRRHYADDLKPFQAGAAAFWARMCERIRLESFPDRPSRNNTVFAFDSIAAAETYADICVAEDLLLSGGANYRKKDRVIYTLEIPDHTQIQYFDMTFIEGLSEVLTYQENALLIQKYWRGEASSQPIFECLLEGEIFPGAIVKCFR